MSVEEITRHFGIAPLLLPIPAGIETTTATPERALRMSFNEPPYWHWSAGRVVIIVDDRKDEVAKALKARTPE